MEKQERNYSRGFKTKAMELSKHRGQPAISGVGTGYFHQSPLQGGQEYEVGKLDENTRPIVTKNAEQLENMAFVKALRGADGTQKANQFLEAFLL